MYKKFVFEVEVAERSGKSKHNEDHEEDNFGAGKHYSIIFHANPTWATKEV